MEMVTTINLDQTLSETLQGFDLDVQGRLVKPMTVRGECFSLSLSLSVCRYSIGFAHHRHVWRF